MNNNEFDFEIKKPISVWNREVSLDFKEFFSAIGKCVVSGAVLDYKGVAESLVDVAKSTGLHEKSAPELAWELINTALLKSSLELVSESIDFFETRKNEADAEELAAILFSTIANLSVGINSDFFDKPQDIELLDKLEQPFIDWLTILGLSEASSHSIYLRLKDRFAINLHTEWTSDPGKYSAIEDAIKSPFLKSTQDLRNWTRYRFWLQQEANKPVFSEAFGLQQVYIPLRAYYEIKQCNSDAERHTIQEHSDQSDHKLVVDAHSEIEAWITNFSSDDAIKVVSGGPGSGKSSFAKILAAKIARDNPEIPVLFVPLHHFDIDGDLTQAIEKFIADDRYLTTNPIDSSNGRSRLLIIFDGLDELSMQGKAASESALAFVDEVVNKFNRFNDQGHKRQALITGRDMAIQSTLNKLRKPKQILNLLPYYIDDEEKRRYTDPDSLLDKDLRNDWWIKYGQAKGLDYHNFPELLNTDKLAPITTEPLLNYLVALTFEGGRVDFTDEITLNTIYSDLLEAVHQRQWDHGNHKSIDHLQKTEFIRILEEIALAVWHGHGRTASTKSILKACENARLIEHLDKFQEGSKKGISRLLTAFYFRESDTSTNSDSTFEFTHKSFGEYLISKRIVRQLDNTCKLIEQYDEDADLGKNEQESLLKWVEVFGPTPIDEYIYEFLKNEIANNTSKSDKWRLYINRLVEYALQKGIPVEKVSNLTLDEMNSHYKNTLESLLTLQSFCIKSSTSHPLLMFKNMPRHRSVDNKISEKISLLLDINTVRNRTVILKSLTYCDFSNCKLDQLNLTNGNISNSNLRHSHMHYTFALKLKANNCSFSNAFLTGSVFLDTSMEKSRFKKARIGQARFERCELNNADFTSAIMYNAIMHLVSAEETSFIKVQATDCNFAESNFSRSNFNFSELENTNFSDSILSQVTFKKANLENANLTNANLSGTDFTNAKIKGIKLTGVIIDKHTILDFDTSNLDKVTLRQVERLREKQKAL